MAILNTLVYLLVDLIAMLLKFGQKYDEKEMYLHHGLSASCLIMSLYAGYGSVGVSNMFLISQSTSIFLKFCYTFPKEQ